MEETTTRPLRRSSTDRIIGGVAGGIARHFGIDPVLVRIGIALTAFFGGLGFVAYVLAWVLMPLDDPSDPTKPGPGLSIGQRDATRILGAVLVVVAAGHVLGRLWWAGDLLLPTALIAAGGWLIFRPDVPRPGPTEPQTAEPQTAEPQTAEPQPDSEAQPADQAPRADAPELGQAHAPTTVASPPVPPPVTPRERPSGVPTARATTGLVALLAGGLWFASNAGADISLETGLLACLAVTGLGLVAGAFLGRGRALIGLAIPLVVALVAVSAVDVPFRGGIGERSYRPVAVSALSDEYRLGVGELVLDLRDLATEDLPRGTTRIEASITMGSLQVLLPRDVSVTGTARAQLGDVEVAGENSSGTDAVRHIDLQGERGSPVLELDLRVGIGEVQVR